MGSENKLPGRLLKWMLYFWADGFSYRFPTSYMGQRVGVEIGKLA